MTLTKAVSLKNGDKVKSERDEERVGADRTSEGNSFQRFQGGSWDKEKVCNWWGIRTSGRVLFVL